MAISGLHHPRKENEIAKKYANNANMSKTKIMITDYFRRFHGKRSSNSKTAYFFAWDT